MAGKFGFIKQAVQGAGKKAFGYGQAAARGARNPEAWRRAATPGVIAGGVGVGGLIAAHEVSKLDNKKDKESVAALREYFGGGVHEKWLNQSFDPETDYTHLRGIANLLHASNPEGYQNAYEGLLAQASKRKGSPSMQELHERIKDMKGVGI